MGVKYNREYNDIVLDLIQKIYGIEDFQTVVELTKAEWDEIPKPDQLAILQTIGDDILFALGEEPVFEIGKGKLVYDAEKHCIDVYSGIAKTGTVNLI